jgi:hypothetical protein
MERPERIKEKGYYYGCSALLLAAESGKLETVEWLLREGGFNIREVSNDGRTAENGHFETVKWLLREGGSDIKEADIWQHWFAACC